LAQQKKKGKDQPPVKGYPADPSKGKKKEK